MPGCLATISGDKLLADKAAGPDLRVDVPSGSYARHTGTKPNGNYGHVDVDLVVVTTLDHEQFNPEAVLKLFALFLDPRVPGTAGSRTIAR